MFSFRLLYCDFLTFASIIFTLMFYVQNQYSGYLSGLMAQPS